MASKYIRALAGQVKKGTMWSCRECAEGIEGDARGFHKEVRKRALKLKNLKFTHGGGRTFSVGGSCGGYCVRNKALPKLEETGPA